MKVDFYINNRKRLMQSMKDASIAIFHSNDQMPRTGDQLFPFRQNSDLLYLTGIEQEKCILVFCKSHPDAFWRESIYSLRPNPTTEKWEGHKLRKEEITAISGIENVQYLNDFDLFYKDLMSYAHEVYLNINEYSNFQTEVASRDLRFASRVKANYPSHKYLRAAPLVTKLRLEKSEEELHILKKACQITSDTFHDILKLIEPGMMEYEIEAEMIYRFKKAGGRGHAFDPIVAGGKNACTLHYVENNNELNNSDLVLLDFGMELENYAADLSRTFPINGKFTLRQKECYEAVLRTYKKAQKLYIPGNTIEQINSQVNQWMEKEMINLGLFSKTELKNQDQENPIRLKYFMHGTAHFIGLDTHDVGGMQTPFKEGMVLSCEPGLYIEEEGIGIRIETDMIVGKEPQNIFKDTAVEIAEIETIMSERK